MYAIRSYYVKKSGYALIDCQVYNEHLASLGASEIPRQQFLAHLQRLLDVRTSAWC